MKKWIFVITIVSLVSLLGIGVVMAQESTPESPGFPGCPNCPFNGTGAGASQEMHTYMVAAMAEALGISVKDYESYRLEGLTFFEMAADLNLDINALSDEIDQVRQEAIEAAFADGLLTQEQYDFLMERAEFGNRFGGDMGRGNELGMGMGKQQGRNFGSGQGRGTAGYQDCPYGQSEITE